MSSPSSVRPAPPEAARYLAPGASSHAVSCPGAVSSHRPSLNDRLVTPETPYEMLDGRLITAPCGPEHGERHMDVGAVLRSHVAPGYRVVVDVLTRVNARSDIAPDISVMRDGTDPATGTRYLEELAFEIKYTQRPGQLTRRATLLAERGVRRIFAVWVKQRKGRIVAGPVKEWQPGQHAWKELAQAAKIEDPCLRLPLPVRALLDATAADEALTRAVLQSQHPLVQTFAQNHFQKGLCQSLITTCEALGIELSEERLAALSAMNADELIALQRDLIQNRRWPDAIG